MSFTSLNLNNCEANLHTKINETDTGAVETSMYPTDHSKKKKKQENKTLHSGQIWQQIYSKQY